MSVGLKQFYFFCSFLFLFSLTVQASHESCLNLISLLKVLLWLEYSDQSFSQPKPPVTTVREPSAMAPDNLLDHSVLLVPVPKL